MEDSYRCSRLALCLFSRYKATEWQARVAVSVYTHAFPLRHSLRDSVDPLLVGHRSGLVSGDIHVSLEVDKEHASFMVPYLCYQFSMLCCFYACMIRLYAGETLPLILETAKAYRKLCPQYGQHFVTPDFDILIRLTLNMMGRSSDLSRSSGEAMQEEEAFETLQGKNPMAFLFFLNFKHFWAVYMNEYEIAHEVADRIKRAKGKMPPVAMITHRFLHAVGCAKTLQQRKLLSKLKESARHCPDNFLHKVYLIEAEVAHSIGCYAEANRKYEMSRAEAERQGFIHEQALACERAARAYYGRGDRDEAMGAFARAISLYGQWGAHFKADQLVAEVANY